MRKLVCANLDKHLILDKNIIYQIVIENSKEYYHFISSLKAELNEKEKDNFCLSENSDVIQLYKYLLLITDLFSLEDTDKKIQTALQKHTQEIVNSSELIIDYNNLLMQMDNFISLLKEMLDISVDYDEEVSVSEFIKFIKLTPGEVSERFLDLIVQHIRTQKQLIGKNIFAVCQISSVLSREEIFLLIKEVQYLEVNLIFIENQFNDFNHPDVECIIIDEDLCEYYK